MEVVLNKIYDYFKNLEKENKITQAFLIGNTNLFEIKEELLNVINKYRDIIAEGEEKIGYTASKLNKSSLGKLAANALRDFADGDFGVLNTGGVRAKNDAGDILMKEIFKE